LIVEFTEAAQLQVDAAAAWWKTNRPLAPTLFGDELAHALALLASSPLLGSVFDDVDGRVVHKVRLPRTKYALYFTVEGEVVTVHALWHGSRGSGPPLL
jgi:plasmid stabilization system protein ParE